MAAYGPVFRKYDENYRPVIGKTFTGPMIGNSYGNNVKYMKIFSDDTEIPYYSYPYFLTTKVPKGKWNGSGFVNTSNSNEFSIVAKKTKSYEASPSYSMDILKSDLIRTTNNLTFESWNRVPSLSDFEGTSIVIADSDSSPIAGSSSNFDFPQVSITITRYMHIDKARSGSYNSSLNGEWSINSYSDLYLIFFPASRPGGKVQIELPVKIKYFDAENRYGNEFDAALSNLKIQYAPVNNTVWNNTLPNTVTWDKQNIRTANVLNSINKSQLRETLIANRFTVTVPASRWMVMAWDLNSFIPQVINIIKSKNDWGWNDPYEDIAEHNVHIYLTTGDHPTSEWGTVYAIPISNM